MPKLPTTSAAQAMKEVEDLLVLCFPHNANMAIRYLLNNFSTFDLLAIRDELKQMRKKHE